MFHDRPPATGRVVEAIHGRNAAKRDFGFEPDLAATLRDSYDRQSLIEQYARFANSDGPLDALMRRSIMMALARRCGSGLAIGPACGFKHPETFEIGSGVFIGAQAYIQGRFDGTCVIGDNVWIGPQAYLDARDLVIGNSVGWGPGAKVLGSVHTGLPADVPVIATDLEIKPVRIGDWADIGTNATIMPGVSVGKGAIIGAGAVVVKDVPDFAVVAGVPATFLYWREGSGPARRAINPEEMLP